MKWLSLVAAFLFSIEIWAATCACQCQIIPDPPTCRVGAPIPVKSQHRGMYISPVASSVGTYTLPAALSPILGNTTNENQLLNFAIKQGVDSWSFYNLNTILPDPGLTQKLSNLIAAAKACGVVEFGAVGSMQGDWDRIKANSKIFTHVVSELEYWNDPVSVHSAFLSYISQLQYIKSLNTGLKISTYLGWLNRDSNVTEVAAAAQIAPLVDRVMLHCYVTDPSKAFGYCQNRIADFAAAGLPIELQPIFSAEGINHNAGGVPFMGDWLGQNSIQSAESTFLTSYKAAYPKPALKLTGFELYEYAFLSAYVGP